MPSGSKKRKGLLKAKLKGDHLRICSVSGSITAHLPTSPPPHLRIIHPRPIIQPIQPAAIAELGFLFFFAVVLQFVFRGTEGQGFGREAGHY